MKSIFNFLKSYKLFSFVIIALIVGIIIYLSSYHKAGDIIVGAATLVAVIPLLIDMVQTIRTGKYGIDILAATAMIASVVLGQYWAGIIIALMLTGGEALEDYAENRAKSELTSLLNNKPRVAHVVKGNDYQDVVLSKVKVGDKIRILPGEVIPIDCVVLDGDTSVDEASITGESLPVDRKKGDEILSGAVNIEGSLTAKVLRAYKDSQYEQIIKLVKSATSSESPFVRLADRYSIPFTVIAYLIAFSAWFVSGHAIRFLDVIVVATPCPLLLAAPIAIISGMSRAAKHGIIIKNGSSLEKLAEAQTIAFDKTGTLTQGRPTVDQVITYNSYKKSDLLKYAAALEQNSNHILAKAIVNQAQESKIKVQAVKQVKEIAGHGLSGRLSGKDVLIGRYSLMEENSITLPKELKQTSIKSTATYVAIDKKLAGVITFSDPPRPESKGMIQKLHDLKIRNILMVTGDNKTTALAVAKKLGIEHVEYECLPADKMKAIERVEDKPVAFVGDGVNDAPVLTLSDIGIALGARGSTAASESADVVIMLDNVGRVAKAIEIAKRTFFIAKQSILVGIFISIGLMVIFSTGHFKPIYGALLQEVVDAIVIFNALRAHGTWKKTQSA